MERARFTYSMKNIPIPPRNPYLKNLIEKTENVIKRMRWKAFFFERNKEKDVNCSDDTKETNNYGRIQIKKMAPHDDDLSNFESDLYDMIKNVEFRNQHNKFQNQLQQDIRKNNSSTKAFIPADKTTNFTRSTSLRTTNYWWTI